MSWTISHGTPGGRFGDRHVRSGKQVDDWRKAMANMPLSARDRAVVEPLTQRRSGDPFTVPPARAGAIAAVLRSIELMPRAQRETNETLAAAAERAAAAGEHWVWS